MPLLSFVRSVGWLFLLLPVFLAGQQLPLRHFTTDAEINPLPVSAIITTFQDGEGFIWLSAYNYGLLRYDGNAFTSYQLEADSLPGRIWSMYEDRTGHLWAAGDEGYVVSSRSIGDLLPGERIHWSGSYRDHKLPDNYIIDHQAILEGPDGRVWMSLDSSILRLDPTHQMPPDTLHFPFEEHEIIYSMFKRASGEVWISTSNDRLFHYDPNTSAIRGIDVENLHGDEAPFTTLFMTEAEGALWGGSSTGVLWRLDSLDNEERFNTLRLGANVYVKSMVDGGNGQLLVATREQGVYSVSLPLGQDIQHYGIREGLLSPNVWDILRDREGNIWMAQNTGLSRMRADYLAFGYYDDNAPTNEAAILPESGVNVVMANVRLWPEEAGAVVLAGTAEGLAVIGSEEDHLVIDQASGLPSSLILSLSRDKEGRTWVATSNGLACITGSIRDLALPGAKTARQISWPGGRKAYLAPLLPTGFVRLVSTLSSPAGKGPEMLLAVTTAGAYVLADGDWYFFNENAGIPEGNDIRSAALSADGSLFLADAKAGLLQSTFPLNLKNLKALQNAEADPDGENFSHQPAGELFRKQALVWQGDTLGQISALSIEGDTLWAASSGGLLTLLTSPLEIRQKISLKVEGREKFLFTSLKAEPEKDRLWAGAQDGVYVFDMREGMLLRHIDRTDGLLNNQVWGLQGLDVGEDGSIYYGTPEGLAIYRPSLDDSLDLAPVPAFTRVQFQQDTWGNNNIQFEYAALSFADEKAVRYRTRLTGFDKSWSHDTTATSMRYTNLPAFLFPRSYHFELMASNADGVWSTMPVEYSFMVKPAWWLRWWAFLLYAGLIFIALRIYVRGKLQAHEIELQKERQLTERLLAVDRLKDQFLANTSHELRTPLNGIIGLADGLMDGVAGKLPRKAVQNLAMISHSGQRLSSLVNDILDYSRLENNEISLEKGPVDMFAVAQIVLTMTRAMVKDKEVELVNHIPRDLPPVHADENRLQQILHNLVGNAVKFTHEGEIKVSAIIEKDNILITVSDTGIGIPADKQEQIFLSFRQADGSISRNYGGTGLGLTITKQLVELHGGSISLRSEEGRGASFTFSLPKYHGHQPSREVADGQTRKMARILPDVSTSPEKEESAVPVAVLKEHARILIVDDEPVNLQVLDNHLSMAGYVVIRASDGAQALEAIEKEWPIDLVLLDIMMPRMSGFEVSERIRQKHSSSALPIVMVTAKNQVSDLVTGFKAGANDYLSKPFAKDELLSRVQTHLRLHSIHHATGKFVPHEFLRAIGRETIMEARLGDQTEREVTVLFSDIRDYTTLSETMTPDQTFRFVNAYYQRIGPIIREHGGFVNQYLGDAIMALFPQTANDALMAAVAMQKKLHAYNEQRRKRGRLSIRSGVGIHSGSLIMGIIGDESRHDAATISDTVNTAARLESLTKHYHASILLSEATLDQKDPAMAFATRYLGQVQVKGKHEIVGIVEGIDGDEPALRDLKLATLNLFQEGRLAFYDRQFAEAVQAFEEIVNVNPDDGPASVFLSRARHLLRHGVEQSWTGIEVMDIK